MSEAGSAINIDDVEYLRHDDKPLLARLYRPGASGQVPAVVVVHGGAWTMGDRFAPDLFSRHLATSGILAFSLDFRMPPAAKYPALIADVNAGIRWLKAHAMELGTHADLIGALGTSSGGHVVLLNALRATDLRYASIPIAPPTLTAELAFVMACWPIADPVSRYFMAREAGTEFLIRAHEAFWADELEMLEGSPQAILDRGEALALPPALILQGTNDANVPVGTATRFAQAYRRADGMIDLELFPDAVHEFVRADPSSADAQRALDLIVSFVWRHATGKVVRPWPLAPVR